MPPLGKYFLIRSKLNDLVLELEEGKSLAGTRVVTWSERGEKEGRDYQLWYRDDNTGTLRNKLNGYCIDLKGEIKGTYTRGRFLEYQIKLTFAFKQAELGELGPNPLPVLS